jgi:uncharacterized protein YkwD
MKVRRSLSLFNLLLIFLSFQTVFSQNNSGKIFYTFGVDTAKNKPLSGRQMPRAVENSAENSPEKSKNAVGENSSSFAALEPLERRVFDLVNERRTAAGLQALSWSKEAAKAARVHSANMATLNFFSHTGSDGKNAAARAASFGLTSWREIGENIATNRGFKSPLESAVQSWMNSPGHRENILKGGWRETGIGVAVKPDGTYFFTQVFVLK